MMMNSKLIKKLSVILIGTSIVSVILAGCGSSDSYAARADKIDYTNDYAASEEIAEEAYYSDDVYEAKMAAGASASNGSDSEITDDDVQASSTRKLIKTVNMSVETREFDELVAKVSNKIEQLGGYAESVSINGNSYGYSSNRSAYIVARIPQNKLDGFVESVEATSNITNKSENAEDVTLQYSDVKARIDSLKIEQTRLNELLENADSLETIVALESRLTEVRYEIESYESRLRTMENQVTYSTVNLDIIEVKEYKPEPIEDPTFGERISEAFVDSCASAFEAIQDFAVGFVAFIPILVVLLVILAFIGGIIFLIVKLIIMITKKSSGKRTVKTRKKKDNSGKIAVALNEPPTNVSGDTTSEGSDSVNK